MTQVWLTSSFVPGHAADKIESAMSDGDTQLFTQEASVHLLWGKFSAVYYVAEYVSQDYPELCGGVC